ncbi:SDR family NAD(P)-dependent oxidoreductase [Streptomyces sp. NBC_01708]|uniref:SDR family NAD(P)-dependent oxidoreductase n=1 Tax=Streptomyces sp. NBC_01708 TaxID=2975915 RepID=UPI002E3179BA|nr:SDR family NAD(P)-dependent oxidoreductase [Streptomyces sp. NBC_01708]
MHHSRLAETPIAIVGLAGLFPQSRNVREFWHNIVDGNDCIEDVPDTHWNLDDYYDPDPAAEDKTYARRGGFLPEIAFNPMEFGLPPNTLEVTDILQLLSLTVARDVLRDAGTEGSGWYDPTRTGVILGVTGANSLTQPLSARLQTPVLKEVVRSVGLSEAQAEEVAERFKKAYIPWEENSFPGMLGNVVAGRIANRFDLGGTNCTVDAACASALAAVKLAVSELVEGRSDLMITGGCDAENTILMYMCFSKTPAFSKSQIIRPFDESADGTLIGEGIGMLALKRLADAERDGDRIYSVLRGIGTSSDGRFKSIYAPRAQGQQLALRRAYEDADVPAGSIELFEAHGTGTAVGDHTELSALGSFVAEGQDARGYAAIGSVKSQIGHTKAAAGAAGLIKLSLALHQKVLPPTINVEQPSAAVDPAETPFYVNSQARPWIADPGRDKRRAAVSSFGFGGTNFHMVLEEHDTTGGKVLGPVARTGLWHAADPEALARRLEQGAAPDPLGWVPAGDARIGIVARSDEEFEALRTTAVELLRAKAGADAWQHPKGITYRRSGIPAGTKAAAVFAGQGSQYVGMGREAALAVPPVLAAYDRANRLTAGAETLGRVVFPPPAFDDATRTAQEESLRRTEFAQPAIGALSAGQFAWFKELGFAPDGVIGHSFGELTALWAAGVLDDDGFTELARARGLAMAPPADASDHDSGAMAAVRGELSAVEALVAGYRDVSVCNINAPGQIVVGGPTAEIDRLVAESASGKVPAKRLPVSAAFHTRFVAHAADAFREAVEGVALNAPRIPVYANTPGAAYGADQAESRRTLVDQLLRPVAFADRIEEMYADGFRVFVEFGPKRVLSDLVDRVLEGREGVRTVAVDGGPAKDGEIALKRAVIELAVLGLPVTGIDDHSAEAPEVRPGKGMAIPLRGINYVTEARRSAYREALAEPSREALPTARPEPVAELASEPGSEPVSEPVAPSREGTAESLSAVAKEGLDLQAEILDAHVSTIQEAVKTLEESVRSGTHPDADAALRLIEQHGASITTAHERATRLLIDALKGEETPTAPAAPAAAPVASVAPAAPVAVAPVEAPAPAQVAAEPAVSAPSGEVNAAVLGALLEVVAEKTGYPVEMLEPGMDVEADLGIDSIKRVQIMGALQERFPVSGEVDPERMGELRTLDDIAGFLASASGATTPAPAGPAAAPAPASVAPVAAAPAAPAPSGEVNAAVLGALLEVVAEKTGYPVEMLEPGMDVEADLGIDSIKRVQIMGALQERFPVSGEVDPERMGELRTLDDIAGFLASASGATAAAPAPVAQVATEPAAPAPSGEVNAAVLGALLEVVAEKTGYPVEMLEPGMDVEADLGIDSIKRVQIMGALQERFPVSGEVDPERMGELRTLDDIAGFLASASGATAAAPAPVAQVATEPAAPAPSDEVNAAVLGALLEVVAEKTGYPVEMLEPGMDVEADLGIDSIKRVQIMGALQERFPVSGEVDPERMGELRTLDDIAGFLASASGPAPTPDGSPVEVSAPAVEAPLVVTYPQAAGVGRTFAAVRELPAVCRVVRAYAEQPVALVLDDGSTLTPPLVAGLRADGWRVEVVVLPGVTTSAEADAVRPLRTWDEQELASAVTAERLDLVVQMAAEAGQEWAGAARRLAHTVLVAKVTQAPLKAAAGDRAAFVAVTRLDGANGYRGGGTGSALLGGVSGLVKTLAIEVPALFTRTVDFAPGLDDRTVAARFLDEIHDVSSDLSDVGVDPEGRRTIVPSAEPPAAHVTAVPEIGAGDLLVVTGGARGITADCLQALVQARPAGLLLLGRSRVTPEPTWSAGAEGAALKGLIAKRITASGEKATPRGVEAVYREVTGSREIQANLDRLRATGATVEYLVVDITDAAAVRTALAPYAARVTGVVHGAGVLADRLIADKTGDEIDRVLGTKIVGLGNVLDALRGSADLRHLVFFSSVAGFFGNRGQSDYAVANEALNRLAVRLRQELPSARVTSVNWGAWDGGMVTDDLRRMFASRGVALVPVATGAGMFAEQFTAARGQDTVVVAGPLTPLSAPPADGSPAAPTLLVDRTLADISADPLLADHTIGGKRVLPATAALGALVNTTERVTGRPVTEVSAFKVFKGLVLDAAQGEGADASRLRLFIEPGPATRPNAIEVLASAVDDAGRSRPSYGASLSTDVTPAPADRADLARAARAANRTDAAPLYRDGTLFHGPALRGIRSVLVAEEGLLLLGARLGDGLPARGAYHGRFHSPVIADLLLQSALVWVRRFRNRASLPLEIGSARFHAELPADREFLIAVENVVSGPSGITCTITALDQEGRVLQVLDGVVVVEDAQLEGKFGTVERTGTATVSV